MLKTINLHTSLVVVLAALLLPTPAFGETYALLKEGVWRADLSNSAPTWVLVVAFKPDDTLLIGLVDGPPPNNDDDDGDDAIRVEKIKSLSRSTLADATEANALSLLVLTIRDTGTTDATRAMQVAVKALARFADREEGARFKAWKAGLDAIITTYDQAALADILSGLNRAWGVSETAGQADRISVMEGNANMAIDIDRLKRLIELVMFFANLFGWLP